MSGDIHLKIASIAADELDERNGRQRKPEIWSEALERSHDDETAARRYYLKTRIAQLGEELTGQSQQPPSGTLEEEIIAELRSGTSQSSVRARLVRDGVPEKEAAVSVRSAFRSHLHYGEWIQHVFRNPFQSGPGEFIVVLGSVAAGVVGAMISIFALPDSLRQGRHTLLVPLVLALALTAGVFSILSRAVFALQRKKKG